MAARELAIMQRTADLSSCGRYRYSLRRRWLGGNSKAVCFIMLNPSTADMVQDDPTIRRCVGFARDWGYSEIAVVNLFAFRATRPRDLLLAHDPVGIDNDESILSVATACDLRIAAWGAWVPLNRDQEVKALLTRNSIAADCLGYTRYGMPRHPLYCRADSILDRFV